MAGFHSLYFRIRHSLVAFVSLRLFRNVTYTIRHGLAAGMRRKGGLGFLPFGERETPETRFLRNLDLSGKTVYDIGGFEGVLTLFFAAKAATVITYEPHPGNFGRCLDNVAVNGLSNVRVFNRGLAENTGEIELVCDPLMPGAGSGDPEIAARIGKSARANRKFQVPVVPLDEDIRRNKLPAPDFIKIDVEGMEHSALGGMKETVAAHRPELYIELHGAEPSDKWENARRVISLVNSWGYRVFDVERREDVDLAAMPGPLPPSHIFCTPVTR